jgi:hypothetical protein
MLFHVKKIFTDCHYGVSNDSKTLEAISKMVFMQKAAVNVMLIVANAEGSEWTMIWLCSFKRTQSRVFEKASRKGD